MSGQANRIGLRVETLHEFVEVGTADCWLWQRYIDENGYGRTWFAGRRNYRAHRAVYELLVGPIPDGLEIDHLCRVTKCVNPDHLEPVTRLVNRRRRPSSRRAACSNGHAMTEANTRTYTLPSGGTTWICRACQRDTANRFNQRRRAVAA